MKFITEADLRATYKANPFTSYTLPAEARLTPGARQYLLDLGVDMYERKKESPIAEKLVVTTETSIRELEKEWLLLKIKCLKPNFLLTAQDLTTLDVLLAQQVTDLGRQFCLLALYVEGKCEVADLCLVPCAGMDEDNFGKALDECVTIDEFHLQLENGRALVLLSRLRSEVALFAKEIEMRALQGDCVTTLITKLNQIANKLSQLICSAIGGTACKKKI